MAEVSVASSVGSGFQLILRKPISVITWGVVEVGFAALMLTLFAPVWMPQIPQLQAMGAAHHGMHAMQGMTAATMQEHLARMMQMMKQMWASSGRVPYYAAYWAPVAHLLVRAMLTNAATRAIVHPRQGVIAFLRIGLAEIFVAFLTVVAAVVVVAVAMACAFGLGHLHAALGGPHMAATSRYVMLGVGFLLAAIILYVALRFAFVVPMIVNDGRFHLFGSWGRTRGAVLPLLLIGLALFVIFLIFQLASGFAYDAVMMGLTKAAGGEAALRALVQRPPIEIYNKLQWWLVGFVALTVVLSGVRRAIFTAPWAKAFRGVVPPTRRGPLQLSEGVGAPTPGGSHSDDSLAPPPPSHDHDTHASDSHGADAHGESHGHGDSHGHSDDHGHGHADDHGHSEHTLLTPPPAATQTPEPEPLRLIEPLRLNPPIAETGDEPARGV